jgi:hypothetical protein
MKRRRDVRLKGICWDCSEMASFGFTRCSKHLYANSKSAKNRRYRLPKEFKKAERTKKTAYRRANSLCLACGIDISDISGWDSLTICPNCLK